MKVDKVLNNNLVFSKNEEDHIVIVMGRGLGFKYKKGDLIDEETIEKVFVPNDQHARQEYVRILESAPKQHFEAINDALGHLKDHWKGELDDRYFLILFDHIAFAIERAEKGLVFQNKLLNEVRNHYPEEFEAALTVVKEINSRLAVHLPEEEAGNIAFHLVNAKTKDQNFEKTMLRMKMVKDMLNLIQYKLNIQLDIHSMRYNRFVTHLEYFIQRILENKQLDNKDLFLYEQFIEKYPEEYKATQAIAEYSKNVAGYEVTDEEKLYFMIHLARFTNQQ
ncbi:PRD domain-containing protein [Oceanobacillus sp. FSL W8-0428]|uniref:BglG family transcription antiterminator n=1 Tax=Oceanobacillus TaxID=182709 RepID=UPI0011BF2620|nr:PRD domain-containing protein [Oceanobacillus sojae]